MAHWLRARHSGLPSIQAGGSIPKRSSAVGAMSSMPGSSAGDLAIAEQHARHQQRVDAMIAAPGLGIVFDDAAA